MSQTKTSDDKTKNIQEAQFLEQNIQNLFFQKQAFQMELTETHSALREIENSKEDAYKLIGQLMIKVSKSKIIDELSEKDKLLNLRIKNLEKQEKSFSEKLEQLREKILGK
ncbi:prefoldin subunit beta [Candidatus Pacearchaeota archaeon]|nr:prefoldin subunit beta [Candidatus Pacearchaeota archaeon]MBI2056784.1 prefoldin subunit beta [Candidatus Pacearchaeota archaeon]